jgi:hypothetical protein
MGVHQAMMGDDGQMGGAGRIPVQFIRPRILEDSTESDRLSLADTGRSIHPSMQSIHPIQSIHM